MKPLAKILAIASLACAAIQVHSHALWDPNGVIKPRSNRDDIKTGPCGEPRSNSPVTLTAGSTVNLSIERTIYHRGYFRIAFSPADDQGFDDHVLADRIPETSSQRFYTVSITLPDTECDACTLQLIQVMLDRNPPTNYYSCADIKLVKAKPQDTQPPAPVGQVLAAPADNAVQLHWQSPADTDLAGVLILEAEIQLNENPLSGQSYLLGNLLGAGTVVFAGPGENVLLKDRQPGRRYYYQLFSYDQNLNYSPAVDTEITLQAPLPNLAPTVTLLAEQNGEIRTRLHQDDGIVRIQANIHDNNAGDRHSAVWRTSDDRLVDQDLVQEQFSFDPAGLPDGEYQISVTVTDDGDPPLAGESAIQLSVESEKTTSSRGGHFGVLLFLLLALNLLKRLRIRR